MKIDNYIANDVTINTHIPQRINSPSQNKVALISFTFSKLKPITTEEESIEEYPDSMCFMLANENIEDLKEFFKRILNRLEKVSG